MTINRDVLDIIRCSDLEDLQILKGNYTALQTIRPEYVILRRFTEVELKKRMRSQMKRGVSVNE